jgi:hypothetical protein
LLIILTCSIAGALLPTAQAQRRAFLRIHVIDQNALNYENVTIEVWKVVLVDSGKTDVEGLWVTRLDGDGRAYEVRAFNGQTMSRDVTIVATDVFVEFSLVRSAPAPVLVVSRVEFLPPKVIAGDRFEAQIEITNIGSLRAATSFLTFVELPSSIAILETGTAFNLGALEINERMNLTPKFLLDRSASRGSYLLRYELTCASETGYSYKSEGAFGMLVGGVPEVKINDVIVDPSTLTRGADGILTLELTNVGTDKAVNLTVRMYNADILTSTISYAGEIKPAEYVDLEFGIHVDKEEKLGVHALNVSLTYADRDGNSYGESKLYEIEVVPPQSLVPTYDILLGVLSSALLIVMFYSLRRLGAI